MSRPTPLSLYRLRKSQKLLISENVSGDKTHDTGENRSKRVSNWTCPLGRMHMSVGVHETNASHCAECHQHEGHGISDTHIFHVVSPC